MSRFKPAANTYVRPMAGWWRKNPFYVWYMIREGSAVFLAVYALVLLAGVYALWQGEAAYNAWRAALATPAALAFHGLTLLVVAYHAYTWFKVMPKTAPKLPVDPRLITAGGIAAALGCSALVLGLLLWVTR